MAKNPVREAERLLQEYGISKPPVDIERIARRMGIRVAEEALGSVSGMLYREGGRAVILINQDEALVRRRFSLAHELGHFVLHESPVFVDRRVRFRDTTSSAGTKWEEVQANRFAAALLMPQAFVLDELYLRRQNRFPETDEELIRELASLFEVSTQAIEFRLAHLGELGTV